MGEKPVILMDPPPFGSPNVLVKTFKVSWGFLSLSFSSPYYLLCTQTRFLLCFVLLFAPLPAPCPHPPIPHSSNLENCSVVLEAVVPKLSLGAIFPRPKLSCSRFRRVSCASFRESQRTRSGAGAFLLVSLR